MIEIEKVKQYGGSTDNLYVSHKAHLIMPSHISLDAASEKAKGEAKIGSTLRGITPTYIDKTGRAGLRVGDIATPEFKQKYQDAYDKHLKQIEFLGGDAPDAAAVDAWFAAVEELNKLNIVNGEYFINHLINDGKNVLAEGAQGSMLDIDFGTYPYVTSSNTLSAGACTGLGVSPLKIRKVFGVFKAYCTRVGSGPFPSELNDEIGEQIRIQGNEFGATTGRPRRTGWLDLVALRYAIMLNGVTDLMMTKADVLSGFEEVNIAHQYKSNNVLIDEMPFNINNNEMVPQYTGYKGWGEEIHDSNSFETLPENFKKYISEIENSIKLPVSLISTGPQREKTILR
jgi:adenylosuccinate synthase